MNKVVFSFDAMAGYTRELVESMPLELCEKLAIVDKKNVTKEYLDDDASLQSVINDGTFCTADYWVRAFMTPEDLKVKNPQNYILVDWDTDGEECDILKCTSMEELGLDDPEDIDVITDAISDEYGWCVNEWYFFSEIS